MPSLAEHWHLRSAVNASQQIRRARRQQRRLPENFKSGLLSQETLPAPFRFIRGRADGVEGFPPQLNVF